MKNIILIWRVVNKYVDIIDIIFILDSDAEPTKFYIKTYHYTNVLQLPRGVQVV